MSVTERISARSLYSLPIVSGCALDRSASRLALCVTTMDETANAYRGSVRALHLGSREIRAYTDGSARDGSPQWSADGEKLYFTSDRGGTTQLWEVDIRGGDPVALPPFDGNVTEFAVSPDGASIAAIVVPKKCRDEVERRGWRRITRIRYRADGPGYFDDLPELWLIDLATRSTRRLTDGKGFVGAPAFSPDGKWLVFTGEHAVDADSLFYRELWVAAATEDWRGREVVQFESAVELPAWSPDGARIAFCGSQSKAAAGGAHNTRLFVAGRDGRDVRCLSAEEAWTCGNAILSDTGAAGGGARCRWISDEVVAVLGSDRGAARVWSCAAGRRASPLTPDTISVVEFDVVDHESVVCVASDQLTPPELYLAGPQKVERLTEETRSFCAGLGLAPPTRFRVNSQGHEIDAWHLAGNGPQPRPAVLQIHGGPHAAYGNGFLFEFALLAANGFDVVYCNPRGSQSYGEQFASAIIGNWGFPAYDDCMAALDAAIARFAIDSRRLGVAGGSYGGYLTAFAIGQTKRFAAAIAMRAAVDLASLWGTSEVGRMLADDFGGRPLDVPDVYRRDSVLTYADAIQTPLLIIHSENDYRTPVEQSEQLFAALAKRGAPVEVLRFLNCDHNLSRIGPPQQRVARLEAIVDWFQRYLLEQSTLGQSKSVSPKPA